MFLLARFARERFYMRDLEQALVLLEAAERDLSALRGMGNNPDFADEVFGFHVQQATEKSFKAWLALLGEEYPVTHDLTWLLKILGEHDTAAMRFESLIDYNPYAVQFRYATDPSVKPLDRDAAVKSLKVLIEYVQGLVADFREVSEEK